MPLLLVSHSPNSPDFLPLLVCASAVVYVLVDKVLSWRGTTNKPKRILGKLLLIVLVGGVFYLAFKFVEALIG